MVSHAAPHIPDHELLRRIGRGSYGEIWLARSVTGAYRAVKIIYRDCFDHERPYEREFAGIQRFEPISRASETQVDILHVGRNDAEGFFYYVMELADDQKAGAQINPESYTPRTLRHELYQRGRLPLQECLDIGFQLATALEHLHENGLVHRDIKPSNIVFVNGTPKLADMGLVAKVDATRSFVGTEGYIPSDGPGTPQADLYSLGKVLYEMSTGRDRLDFPELPTDLKDHPEKERLVQFNEVLLKACAEDRKRRYQTAAEMLRDLRKLKAGGVLRRTRSIVGWKGIALFALVLVLLAAGLIAGMKRSSSRRTRDLGSDMQPSEKPDCLSLPAGLVGWWQANGDAFDMIGGNDGTLVGDVAYGSGRVRQGFAIGGVGDGVDIGAPVNLQLQTFTIEAWIKRASSKRATLSQHFGASLFSGSSEDYSFGIWDDGRLCLSKVDVSAVSSLISVTDATAFHHVAVTKSGSSVVFYMDGVAEAAAPYDPGFSFNGPKAIGARGGDYGASFHGVIDELSVYNRALPATEIQAIYAAGSAGKCVTHTAPVIAVPPSNEEATVGETTMFSVTAAGTGPLSYQWRFNGDDLAGATASSLVLMNVQFANAGNYSAIISNSAGTATSGNAMLTVAPRPPCANPASGLVSWWRGEGKAVDEVGSNDGMLAGNAAYGAGRADFGFVLDGNADGINIGNPVNLQLQTFTIETWIKRASSSRTTRGPQLGASLFSGPLGDYSFGIWDDGRLWLSKVGVNHVSTTNKVADISEFHHVAVTKSGAVVVFYVDGVAEAVASYDPGFVFNGSKAIGARGEDYGTSFYGAIDEVSVYNRALSAPEIQEIHNAGISGKCLLAPMPVARPATTK